MEIRGTLEPADLGAARWLHVKPRTSFAILGLVLVLGLVWVFWQAIQQYERQGLEWPKWFILGTVAFFVFSHTVLGPLMTRRAFRQIKALQRSVTIDASDDAFSISAETGQDHKPWSDFHDWKEDRKVFLLYTSDNTYLIVPKRFFSCTEDISAFQQRLREKVRAYEA